MCTVSMISDDWNKRVGPTQILSLMRTESGPTREEFEALKQEVEALKGLLKAAKIYDEQTGQPDCETDEKMALLRQIAEKVGVDLEL